MRPDTTHTNLGTYIKVVSISFLLLLFIGYSLFQARNFIQGPAIQITNNITGTIQHERTIPIEGIAKNIVKITLNGREIYTNKEGVFAETLVLENGYTIMTLQAQDRFGRTTSLTREYVYVPPTPE